ncbi:Endoglucanase 24 [Ananas comosus]|uniref:Endoglucanase n=1 Tax=Ananas comosus TaxID=4615 RepID=A0A199VJN8_ANACO|nr:Endoglucanase 24 [Ananas comosus]
MGVAKYTKGCCGWLIVLIVAALVVTAAVVAIKKRKPHHAEVLPVPGPPGAINQKYADALGIALQFFQVQKSGKLVNNKISWRGDSALDDGREAGLDLSKGMYDAGDHMKFGFPMAYTATVLSWSILEYGDQMSAVKQLNPALDALKWITDYLINAHPSDNVLYIQVLLSRINIFGSKQSSNAENVGLQMYRKTAEAVMCGLLPDSPTATSSRTESGLLWIDEWNALQHPVAASFLAVVYSDYMLTSQTPEVHCNGDSYTPIDLRKFAMSQADYILGDNPMKLSYLVGYGSSYPQQVHHRGASIPTEANTGCKGFQWLTSTEPNPNVATGALVGGPFKNDSYIDLRNNSMQAEPSTYNSAVLVGLLSGLVTTSSVAQSFT